jgi:hypothetical protein
MRRSKQPLARFLWILPTLAGCAAGPSPQALITEDYFTPIPPDLPRIQYVRGFSGSKDFRARNRLVEYIAGTENVKDYVFEKPFSVASEIQSALVASGRIVAWS